MSIPKSLLRRSSLLFLEPFKAADILAKLFRQGPRRLQGEHDSAGPRSCVGLRVVDGDLVLQMVAVDAPDVFDNAQRVAVRVADAVEPSLLVEIHRVGNQRISLPMPDRVAHPQSTERRVMSAAVG